MAAIRNGVERSVGGKWPNDAPRVPPVPAFPRDCNALEMRREKSLGGSSPSASAEVKMKRGARRPFLLAPTPLVDVAATPLSHGNTFLSVECTKMPEGVTCSHVMVLSSPRVHLKSYAPIVFPFSHWPKPVTILDVLPSDSVLRPRAVHVVGGS